MEELEGWIADYLDVCERQRALAAKTVAAYRADLRQLGRMLHGQPLSREALTGFVAELNAQYKPRSVKRKVASAKAFCRWLEEEGCLKEDPFRRLHIRLRQPKTLPRTVPLRTIEEMLRRACALSESGYGGEPARRVHAVLELLFATGLRVSELCRLNVQDVDLKDGSIMIWGKGAKERLLQIGNISVLKALRRYAGLSARRGSEPFFANRAGRRLSEQSVRQIVRRYGEQASQPMAVTPHMLRHSFATLLLEEDVDIRYIQRMLGHTSIMTTQIYTDVAAAKQKEILTNHHPRNRIAL